MAVLILAEDVDATCDSVVNALLERGTVVHRVNTAWFPAQLSVSAELRRGRWTGQIRTPGRVIDLEEITAVWYRTPRAYQFPGTLSASEKAHANLEAKYGLGGVLSSLPVLWANHPGRLADAAYKPVQLVTASRCGLTVPDTVITNEADTVREFAAGGKTVTKLFGSNTILEEGVRKISFTRLLDDADLADLRGIETTTHLVQRWAPKLHEVRMVVIGENITAAALRAGSPEGYVDFRSDYDTLSYELIEPPAEVCDGVRRLMTAMDLVYGALDFVVGPDGTFSFLEINAGGQFGFIEDKTGAPLTAQFADLSRQGDTVTSTLDTDWTTHAHRLADTLQASGDLRSPQWHAAVSAVPRHLLVPRAYQQDDTGTWSGFETATALERVYSPETLVTALETVGAHRLPISSSTKPDLMVRMLEILDVHDGHRVLEIGTGTGYNAALLAHRLGDDRVFSVDVGDDLVGLARQRLATAGFHPTLLAVDGVHGLARHAPFDRIIATCSVPAVPWRWAEQLAPDGTILVDLKLANSAGNLVHLRHAGNRLQGRFTSRWAAFMAMRSGPTPVPATRAESAPGGQRRNTDAPAEPWNKASVAWFLAQLRVPPGTSFTYILDPATRAPVATTFSGADGSWARVHLTDGTVTEAGDTPLWPHVEWAYEQWTGAGRPAWDRLGLTVTSDGVHQVWLDDPDSSHRWLLPTAE